MTADEGTVHFGLAGGRGAQSVTRSLWSRRPAGGTTDSVALVTNGVAVITRDDHQLNRLSLLSLERGEPLWERSLSSVVSLAVGDEVSLAADDRAVYAAGGAGAVAFSAGGDLLWKQDPLAEDELLNVVTAPLLGGEIIYWASNRHRVVALERKSGRLLWRGEGAAAAALALYGEMLLSVSYTAKDVVGQERRTGAVRWRRPLAQMQHTDRLTSAMGLAGGGPFYLIDDGALRALDPASGAEHWARPTRGLVSYAPKDGLVVVADEGGTRCLDAVTGAVRWEVHGEGFALAAPLDGVGALVLRQGRAQVFAWTNGQVQEGPAAGKLLEQDRVLCAGDRVVVATLGGRTAIVTRGQGHPSVTMVGPVDLREVRVQQAVVRGSHAALASTGGQVEGLEVAGSPR